MNQNQNQNEFNEPRSGYPEKPAHVMGVDMAEGLPEARAPRAHSAPAEKADCKWVQFRIEFTKPGEVLCVAPKMELGFSTLYLDVLVLIDTKGQESGRPREAKRVKRSVTSDADMTAAEASALSSQKDLFTE